MRAKRINVRVVHDTLGHTLSLIVLKSELAEKLAHRSADKTANEAREIHSAASAALKQMREMVSDMKIVRLAEEWNHARMLCAAANVRIRIEDRSEDFPYTPLQESALAMCIKEAVTNVVRHSGASECRIGISVNEGAITCTVADNGRGPDKETSAGGAGNGLVGMKQRLALLEGKLTVEDGDGRGFRLRMEIPIVKRQMQKGATVI